MEPKIQKRFAQLIKELGKKFDGKIEGINLQETAISDKSRIYVLELSGTIFH